MRKSDNEEEIQKRLQRLPEEYEKAKYFDYDITNDDLESTLKAILRIIHKKQGMGHYVSKQSL